MHKLDHIVFGASTLEEGTEFVENILQAKLSDIGYHKDMGTHNRVIRISERIYLEVIAIDPKISNLNNRKWFNLDDSSIQSKLKKSPALAKLSASCKAAAKRKFKVYPSAYANMWAAKTQRQGKC